MSSFVVPGEFVKVIERAGCTVEFMDSTYMCAHRKGIQTDIDFQKNTSRYFFRYLGDHLIILAYKKRKT